MFSFSKIADEFDDHISSQLFWHSDFLNHFLPEIASVFMQTSSIVYDFGASTGNVEVALKEKINERDVEFVAIEKCQEMIKNYKGNKENVSVNDFLKTRLEPFSFATSILALSFIHPSDRVSFIEKVKKRCKKGGAFLILEKMVNHSGYLGVALNRVTWKNKIEQGSSLTNVINKELSLSGVQYPLSDSELDGFDLIWAYGDFRSYIWRNGF